MFFYRLSGVWNVCWPTGGHILSTTTSPAGPPFPVHGTLVSPIFDKQLRGNHSRYYGQSSFCHLLHAAQTRPSTRNAATPHQWRMVSPRRQHPVLPHSPLRLVYRSGNYDFTLLFPWLPEPGEPRLQPSSSKPIIILYRRLSVGFGSSPATPPCTALLLTTLQLTPTSFILLTPVSTIYILYNATTQCHLTSKYSALYT